MRALVLVTLVALASPARADGFYYAQSYGISSARGEARPMLGESLQLRINMGWRWGNLSLGPWFAGHLAMQREGAIYGLVGGDPPEGDSDVEGGGIDARYNAPLPWEHVSIYVRGGPRYASAMGALDGYRGFGVGAGTGIQVTGKVRALGFLFAPFFFMKKGPMINAVLFVDQNVDWYRLSRDDMSTISLPLVGSSVGFGAGSFF